MRTEPDDLADRQRTIPRSELKMQDQQSLEETAEVGEELAREFDL